MLINNKNLTCPGTKAKDVPEDMRKQQLRYPEKKTVKHVSEDVRNDGDGGVGCWAEKMSTAGAIVSGEDIK